MPRCLAARRSQRRVATVSQQPSRPHTHRSPSSTTGVAHLTAVTPGTAVEGAVEHDPSPETDAGLHGGEGGDPTSLPEPLFGQRLGPGVVLDPHRQSGGRGNLACQAVADGTRDVDRAEHLAGRIARARGGDADADQGAMGLQPLDDRQDGAADLGPSEASEIGTSSRGRDGRGRRPALRVRGDCAARLRRPSRHRPRTTPVAPACRRGRPGRGCGVFGFELLEESVVDQSLHDRADRRPSDVGETGEVGA